MRFATRKFPNRKRRGPAALALAPLLLALALLVGASPAAAQEWPEVKAYHSPGDDGGDPRPEAPPGCEIVGGGANGGTGNVFVWDPASRGAGLVSDLADMGNTVTTSSALPADLTPFDVIWHIGYIPWAAEEISRVIDFIAAGGGVYLTGEHTAYDIPNDSVEAVINGVISGFTVTVGEQGNPGGPYNFNPGALGGITTTPNVLTTWTPSLPGGVASTPDDETVFDNTLATGAGDIAVGGVAGPGDMLTGVGRVVLLMDVDWLDNAGRTPIVENIQTFLIADSGGGSTLDCVIQGGADEEIHLWIDGGSNGGSGDLCKMGGNDGDILCGADILLEVTQGTGQFSGIRPVIDTLVYYPDCVDGPDEGGFCSFPFDEGEQQPQRIRMNFRRGTGPLAAMPRKVADIRVNSTGSTEASQTVIKVSGEAASANLQVRPIAPDEPEVLAAGPMPVPEPGRILLLASGLAGLSFLHRRRRRA